MTGNVADSLIALHDAKPDFRLINLPEAADLPTVRWKLVKLEMHYTLGQVAISSRKSRLAFSSPETAIRCREGRASLRDFLKTHPIRRIRRTICHRAVFGSIQTPDHH